MLHIGARATFCATLAGGLVALSACAVPVGHLPMASTRAISAADLERPRVLSTTVTGRSCIWVAVVAPIGFPSLSAALDEALEAGGATALWDVDVAYSIRYLPPLVGRTCYVVSGRVP